MGISRYTAKELQQSTMETFFKVCPPELYSEAYGGRRNDREGYLRLVNGSEVLWMHLDDYAEEDLRGKEFNSVLTDQAEEISEAIYITLDARIERWDQAQIPPYLNAEAFKKNPFTGKPEPPCYNMILCNPDTTLHWIYRRFHPDSSESEKYLDTHAYFSASTHDNPAIPESLKAEMRRRDAAWVDRFYWGKWGVAGGAIWYVPDSCILDYVGSEKLLEVILRDGIKYRVMDHGDAAPTSVLWVGYLSPSTMYRAFGVKSKGIHVVYREYYQPNKLISHHRESIAALSGSERYTGNYADPAIFKKNSQKAGGFWSVADSYLAKDKYNTAPPIAWSPADNNELATRNALGEMLLLDKDIHHPITNEPNSPALYFIRKSPAYPFGASHCIQQLKSAKRKKIGQVDGQDIYSDERVGGEDHALDPLRYYSLIPKTVDQPEAPREMPQFSFNRHMAKVRRYQLYRGRFVGR